MGKLSIIGLGLIGGSMGLALSNSKAVRGEVHGYDRDSKAGERAKKAGAVQHLAGSAEEAARDASLVIIATPILAMRRVMEEIAPHLQAGTVVTDTASTKSDVLRWARELLPRDVHFVGGHPMAGKEKAGPEAAEASLFEGRPYCVVPGIDAAEGAVSSIVGMAEAIGARPFFLDAEEHDAYAAAISHVPLVTSIALFRLAKGSAAWPELANMAGPAFYDLTRLASGQAEMTQDIFLSNKDNLLHWLDRYIAELEKLRGVIQEEDREAMFRQLAEVQFERDNFLLNPPRREDAGPKVEMPSVSESFMNIMAGALWTQRSKEMQEAMEERARAREHEQRLTRRDL